MLTKCYFCGGSVKEEDVSVDFWWGEKLVIFEAVPAKVCQQCGERFFEAAVYKEMERVAQVEVKPSKSIVVNIVNFRETIKV